ncbi:MAG TPA: ABC transporter ATP-binding protein [Acidimicrobiales bacterium]|nr:ABC transporter ATP-binding protein [Acidimicrobiales bacterium]
MLLEVRGAVKRFRRGTEVIAALDGVDLDVGAGEFVALYGPSGSGKSTLIHLGAGLDDPDDGVIRLDGRDLATCSTRERAKIRRQRVGLVFQFFHLLPALTVTENVELPLLLDGRTPNGLTAGLLERVGLTDRARHLPGELSGGQLQRAAIARALVTEPSLILADEPTGNLDSATGATVLDVLETAVRESGAGMLLVTHDEGVAARADRVVRLRDGRFE